MKKNDINSLISNHIKNASESTLTYSAWAGENVGSSIENAIAIAKYTGKKVSFDFNGIGLSVSGDSDPKKVYKEWDDGTERRRQAYLASPEYAAQRAKQEKECIRCQAVLDKLMTTIDKSLKDTETLCHWLNELTEVYDGSGATCDMQLIHDKIIAAGYKLNDFCFTARSTEVEKNKLRVQLATDKEAFGRYLVGQALDGISRGMGPHPMFCTFYKRDYLKMGK